MLYFGVSLILFGSLGLLLYLVEQHLNVISDSRMKALFSERRSEFMALRDMMLSETNIFSVGDDNVNHFYLHHGMWQHDSDFCTEEQMLKTTGLSPERYRTYLELLSSVGAYRVVGKGIWGRSEEQVAIHIYREGLGVSGQTKNIIFSPIPPHNRYDMNGRLRVSYSKIEDGWFIEHTMD